MYLTSQTTLNSIKINQKYWFYQSDQSLNILKNTKKRLFYQSDQSLNIQKQKKTFALPVEPVFWENRPPPYNGLTM